MLPRAWLYLLLAIPLAAAGGARTTFANADGSLVIGVPNGIVHFLC
jgi:hypothetical protein